MCSPPYLDSLTTLSSSARSYTPLICYRAPLVLRQAPTQSWGDCGKFNSNIHVLQALPILWQVNKLCLCLSNPSSTRAVLGIHSPSLTLPMSAWGDWVTTSEFWECTARVRVTLNENLELKWVIARCRYRAICSPRLRALIMPIWQISGSSQCPLRTSGYDSKPCPRCRSEGPKSRIHNCISDKCLAKPAVSHWDPPWWYDVNLSSRHTLQLTTRIKILPQHSLQCIYNTLFCKRFTFTIDWNIVLERKL